MDWGADMSTVQVTRGLLREILEDGTCPLHLRMELQKVLRPATSKSPSSEVVVEPTCINGEDLRQVVQLADIAAEPSASDSQYICPVARTETLTEPSGFNGDSCTVEPVVEITTELSGEDDSCTVEPVAEITTELSGDSAECVCPVVPLVDLTCQDASILDESQGDRICDVEQAAHEVVAGKGCDAEWKLEDLTSPCLFYVAVNIPLTELLAIRACSQRCLCCFTQRALPELEDLLKMQSRIRARLWIERVVALTRDTSDETLFESQVRSFANDALRRRMESEMAEAKVDMERQIHAFQLDVDRRMEEQAQRVHSIIEERVHQQVEMILSAEMEKVRIMAEERVQERVRTVLQEEVLATVREMQARLTNLAQENEQLRNAFAEHLDHSDLCYRSLVWALSPNATGFFARTLRFVWCCRRRLTKFSAQLLGVPPDKRKERLRMRLEALRRALDSDENLRARLTVGEGAVDGQLQGEMIEGSLPPVTRPLMALMAAAQSADASLDGASALNPFEPTDLVAAATRGNADFSVTESASATATVIAAALLLASQANRRNAGAGADAGRSSSAEAPQPELAIQALPENASSSDAPDPAAASSEEIPQEVVEAQREALLDASTATDSPDPTAGPSEEVPQEYVDVPQEEVDIADKALPDASDGCDAPMSLASTPEEIPQEVEAQHEDTDDRQASPDASSDTPDAAAATSEEAPQEVEAAHEEMSDRQEVPQDVSYLQHTQLEAPSEIWEDSEEEELQEDPIVEDEQSEPSQPDDFLAFDEDEIYHDLPSDVESVHDDDCQSASFETASERDAAEETDGVQHMEVQREDVEECDVVEQHVDVEADASEPLQSSEGRNAVPNCHMQDRPDVIEEGELHGCGAATVTSPLLVCDGQDSIATSPALECLAREQPQANGDDGNISVDASDSGAAIAEDCEAQRHPDIIDAEECTNTNAMDPTSPVPSSMST